MKTKPVENVLEYIRKIKQAIERYDKVIIPVNGYTECRVVEGNPGFQIVLNTDEEYDLLVNNGQYDYTIVDLYRLPKKYTKETFVKESKRNEINIKLTKVLEQLEYLKQDLDDKQKEKLITEAQNLIERTVYREN